jgi:hypothetical protein
MAKPPYKLIQQDIDSFEFYFAELIRTHNKLLEIANQCRAIGLDKLADNIETTTSNAEMWASEVETTIVKAMNRR